jgi:hypothetical protein
MGKATFVFEVWDVYSICDTCNANPRRDWFISQWTARKNYVRRSERNIKRLSPPYYSVLHTWEDELFSSVPKGERF